MTGVEEVYEVFKEYFGEDKVDLQDDRTDFNVKNIIVWFPEVTVTNEKDESVVITDLYVKIRLSLEGLCIGKFSMTRGSYKLSQVQSGYIHSHAFRIPHESHAYTDVCLGEGPIVSTISLLSIDNDLDRWKLFCFELDKYVSVESEKGVPYHHLNKISKSNWGVSSLELRYGGVSSSGWERLPSFFGDFISWFIYKRLLNFSREGNHWFIAHSFLEYISILTSAFREFVIQKGLNPNILFSLNLMYRGQYKNGVFETRTLDQHSSYIGSPAGLTACTFKGEDKIITVEDDLVNVDDSRDVIVHPGIANIIVYKILSVLNYGTIKFEGRRGIIL